jgi:hypothetical protein
MPFLLAEILNFQGSIHRIGVGSFSMKLSYRKQIILVTIQQVMSFIALQKNTAHS